MINHPTPDDLHEAAADLRRLTGVEAVDVIEHDQRLDRPVLELVTTRRYERVPPKVLRELAKHDLGLWPPATSAPRSRTHE